MRIPFTKNWEWEIISEVIEETIFETEDRENFGFPIEKFHVERGENSTFDLTIERKVEPKEIFGDPFDVESVPGQIRTVNNVYEFRSLGGALIELGGVTAHNWQTNERSEQTIKCSLRYARVDFQEDNEAYCFHWLLNLYTGNCIFPDSIAVRDSERIEIDFGSLEFREKESTNEKRSRGCATITIGGEECRLCKYDTIGSQNRDTAAALIVNADTEIEIGKLLDCLSFAFGKPLIRLGRTAFTSEWGLSKIEGVSPYSDNGAYFKIHGLSPCPLGREQKTQYADILDQERFQRLVQNLYDRYDELDLGYVFRLYWNARRSGPDVRSADFGSAIEALIKNQDKVDMRIVPKEKFGPVKSQLKRIVFSTEFSEDNKVALWQKMSQANTISLKQKIERIFDRYEMELSETERNAWKRRDDAAHGNPMPDSDAERENMIRDGTALNVLFNRLIFALTESSDIYTDYFTLRFPVRNIRDGIPTSALIS